MNPLDLLLEDAGRRAQGRIQGVVVGVVTNNEDPDKMGRVKVKFPWLSGEDESHWARVAAPMAGKERGIYFLPEVDDEVLVAFDNGHFGQPYVVGRLWNGKDKPPETETQNRVLKTPGGHQLRFEDKAGSKKVIVKTDGGLTITMDDTTQSIEIKGGGRAVTMKAGQLTIT